MNSSLVRSSGTRAGAYLPARVCLAVWLALVSGAAPRSVAAEVQAPVTGILGAMPVEVQLLEAQLQDKKEVVLLGREFTTGTLAGRRVVVTCSGVGKVNAAVAAALLVEHFRPAEVIFTGVAGAIGPTNKTLSLSPPSTSPRACCL